MCLSYSASGRDEADAASYLQKILEQNLEKADSASDISRAGSSTAAFCIHHWHCVLYTRIRQWQNRQSQRKIAKKKTKSQQRQRRFNFKFSSSPKFQNASLTKVFALQNTCKLAQGHHTVHTAPPYDLSLLLYTACGCLPTVEGCREEIF